MKKFGTFSNPDMQPRATGYYDRFNRYRGIPNSPRYSRPKVRWTRRMPGIFAAVAVCGLVFIVAKPVFLGILSPITGCNIKGNISINSRERIYHVPGQHYYAETKISPQYGERYFCSEAEARAAGWRKSGI